MDMNLMHQLRLVAYAILEYDGHASEYCLTNYDEVDNLNQKIQTLIECKTNFSVSFSKKVER